MSQDTRQTSQDIERAQQRGFARSIAGVEWLLLLLVALYLFATEPTARDDVLVVAALVGFAAFLLILRVLPQLRSRTTVKLALEICAMVGFLTVVLSQMDGAASPLLNLYLLPIIAASLTLGKRATALITLAVCLCYALLVTAERGIASVSAAQLTVAAAVLVPFLLVAFLTSLLAEDILRAQRRIRSLSDRDGLTKLLNIRAFMRMAEREHRNAASSDGAYSVLLIDVDHLRQINDAYGHEAGNKALRTVAEALLRVAGTDDIVARFGGEEFIVCLLGKELAAATEFAQRLRNVVYSSTFEVNVDIVRIQVSVGAASYPADGETLERVMSAAERAMYTDKELRTQPEGQLVIQKR